MNANFILDLDGQMFNANSPSIFDVEVQKETMSDEKYNSHQKLLEMNFQKSADKSNTSSGINLFGSARRINGE